MFTDPGNDFFQNIDPGSSLGNSVENEYDKAMSSYGGSSYPQQNININSGNQNQGNSEAFGSLGGGIKELLKPKSAAAKANQKYRQDKREAKRSKQGGTKVGNFLRKKFKTGNQNPNLK